MRLSPAVYCGCEGVLRDSCDVELMVLGKGRSSDKLVSCGSYISSDGSIS